MANLAVRVLKGEADKLGVRVLGGLGMVVVAALVAMAPYVDWVAWELEESWELMDWTWHERVARFAVIFLNTVDSATDSSLMRVLALGNRTAQWLFAKNQNIWQICLGIHCLFL